MDFIMNCTDILISNIEQIILCIILGHRRDQMKKINEKNKKFKAFNESLISINQKITIARQIKNNDFELLKELVIESRKEFDDACKRFGIIK